MIAIIGVGQLGQELLSACDRLGLACRGLTHDDIELTEPSDFQFQIPSEATTVINTAAFHNLEECEKDQWLAWRVNSHGSAALASYCRWQKKKYVFVSSDYCGNCTPTDASSFPLSVYAKTKLAGELAALSICPDALVVRLGTLYGVAGCAGKPGRGNLIDTIVEKVKKQEPFTLPDYTSVPITSAKRAAERILKNLDKSGVWYGTDPTANTSHYKLGQRIATYLHLPDKIMAVSKDPNDTLRPNTASVGQLLPWTTCPANASSDYLREYLVEKGHIDG